MGVSFLRRLLGLHPVVNVVHIYLQNKNVYRNKKRNDKRRDGNNKKEIQSPLKGHPFEIQTTLYFLVSKTQDCAVPIILQARILAMPLKSLP